MTTPDPADVHTGTDRVELTDAEYDQLSDALKLEPPTPDAPMYYVGGIDAVVASIVAARVQALTAEDRTEPLQDALNATVAQRDAARAELAAANARTRELEREIDERDKAHEGIVATITAAARADTRTAKSDAAKVQMLAERVDALRLSRDKHRNRADALQARVNELEAEHGQR